MSGVELLTWRCDEAETKEALQVGKTYDFVSDICKHFGRLCVFIPSCRAALKAQKPRRVTWCCSGNVQYIAAAGDTQSDAEQKSEHSQSSVIQSQLSIVHDNLCNLDATGYYFLCCLFRYESVVNINHN